MTRSNAPATCLRGLGSAKVQSRLVIIKGSLDVKGLGCLLCLPEALDLAPPPARATPTRGPARSLHSSRADGPRPVTRAKVSVRLRGPQVRAAPRHWGPRRRIWNELERDPDTAGNPGRPTTEQGAPAGRPRAAPPGPVPPVRRNLNAGPRSCAPRPRPVTSGLTQTTKGMLAPSPRTQSSGCIPPWKYSHSDACTAAILPRGGRRLLTLAPTRRARAPIRAFSARTEAVVPRFRAAAAPRPVARAPDWLSARDLAISREEPEGTAAGASALSFPPRLCRSPRLRFPCPAPPPLPAGPAPRAAAETAQRGRRDPHGKMVMVGPGGRAERPRGARGGKRGWRGGRTCAGSSGVLGPSRCQVAAGSRAAAPPGFASQTARCSGRSCPAPWSYRGNIAGGGLAFGTEILRHGTGVFARRSMLITTASSRHGTGENGPCCSGSKCPPSELDCSLCLLEFGC